MNLKQHFVGCVARGSRMRRDERHREVKEKRAIKHPIQMRRRCGFFLLLPPGPVALLTYALPSSRSSLCGALWCNHTVFFFYIQIYSNISKTFSQYT